MNYGNSVGELYDLYFVFMCYILNVIYTGVFTGGKRKLRIKRKNKIFFRRAIIMYVYNFHERL